MAVGGMEVGAGGWVGAGWAARVAATMVLIADWSGVAGAAGAQLARISESTTNTTAAISIYLLLGNLWFFDSIFIFIFSFILNLSLSSASS
jgi:hypothetical protein